MTTYYVVPETGGGSPSGSGTLADPWNGLADINWATPGAGDTVDFGGNTFTDNAISYQGGGGAAGNPLTLKDGIFDGTSTSVSTQILLFAGDDHITFDNIQIVDWCATTVAATGWAVRWGNPMASGITFTGCLFDGTNAGGTSATTIAQLNADGTTDLDDLSFINCEFRNTPGHCAFIRMTAEGDTAEINNLRFQGCYFTNNDKGAIWVTYGDGNGNDLVGGRTQQNTQIIGNRFASFDAPGINIRGTTNNSRIAWNTFTNLGSASETVNAINPGGDVGLTIEDNTIIGVDGSGGTGDGNAIIVDWWKVDANASTGVKVLRNKIEDCKKVSAPTCSGVSLFKGINSEVVGNSIYDTNTGMKIGSSVCTGNVLSHNSIGGAIHQGFRTIGSSPASIVKNNILHTTGLHAVTNQAGSTLATLSYNCYFGYTEAEPILDDATPISEDINSIITDPLFLDLTNGDLRIDGDSPCIAKGETLTEGEQVMGQDGLRFYANPSIGAFEPQPKSGYAIKARGLVANVMPAGVDIAKAKAA